MSNGFLSGLIASSSKLTVEDDARLSRSRSKEDVSTTLLSSSLTELDGEIAAAQICIFEIQELRHTSAQPASSTNGKSKSDAVSGADEALIRLDARLEILSREAEKAIVKARRSDDVTLQERAQCLHEDWTRLQNDADQTREELKEDKWLVVFRTAFSWDIRKGTRGSTSSASSSTSSLATSYTLETGNDADSLRTELDSLRRAFNSKQKYYVPSTDKVMLILEKGIKDRKTKNGEVLRHYADMKSRWTDLQERMQRVEQDLVAVDEKLHRASDTQLTPQRPRGGSASSPAHRDAELPTSHSSPHLSASSSGSPSRPPLLTNGSKRQSYASPSRIASIAAETNGHRYSRSASSASPAKGQTYSPAVNPSPSLRGAEARPRWVSTAKLGPKDDRLPARVIRKRPSALGLPGAPPRPSSPPPPLPNGRETPRPSSPSVASSTSSRAVSMHHRPRPSSPSRIPMPGVIWNADEDEEQPTSLMQRAFSPTPSEARYGNGSSAVRAKPRMSFSPSTSRTKELRAQLQTPEPSLSARAQRIAGLYGTAPRASLTTPSFRRAMSPAFADSPSNRGPYTPNPRDPLDVEVAAIVKAQTIPLSIMRLDPPLPKGSKLVAGESFAYSISGSKPMQIKMLEITRYGVSSKKVMIRVGGQWQDLELFLLDQQAAMT